MFESIKKWYAMGLWNSTMVKQAVMKNIITSEQYEMIINKS